MAQRQKNARPPYWVPPLDILRLIIAAAAAVPLLTLIRPSAPAIAPSVSAPIAGAVLAPDALGRVSGDAPAGSQVQVKFGNQEVATTTADANGKWSLPVPTLPEGEQVIRAVFKDATGAALGEKEVLVRVSAPQVAAATSAPTATAVPIRLPAITPPNLATDFSKGGVIAGTAEPNEQIEIFVDGKSVGKTTADASGNWTFELPALQPGIPTVFAQTVSGKSPELKLPQIKLPEVTLPVINLPDFSLPGVTLPDFAAGATITGTAKPGEKVDVLVDGKSVGTTTADAKGNWSFELPKLSGLPVISIQTPSGKSPEIKLPEIKLPEVTLPVINLPDFSLPGVTLPDFAAGATITGTAKPGEKVDVLVDGKSVGTTTADAKGNWSFELPKLSGLPVISIQTPSGKSPEIKLPEVKLPQIKLPVITLPKLGIDFSKGGTITGTALPNEKVEVSVNGKSVGTTTADANGNWKFELPKLDVGLPVISVNTPSGKSIDVKLPEIKAPEVILPKIVLPSVNLPDFAAGATITGTAKPGERVQILLDGRVLGSAVADDKGNWSYQLPKLILGERVLGTRSASGVGPDVKISVLDKTLPVITVPTGGIVIDVTNGGRVRGTAGPNAKVDVLVDGKTVGTTTADARGNWTSAVPAQKAGDYVITAKSAAGTSDNVQVNVSEQTKILLPVTGGN